MLSHLSTKIDNLIIYAPKTKLNNYASSPKRNKYNINSMTCPIKPTHMSIQIIFNGGLDLQKNETRLN